MAVNGVEFNVGLNLLVYVYIDYQCEPQGAVTWTKLGP